MLETTKSVKLTRPSLFAFRQPLRKGRLYLIVDGVSFPHLEAALNESGLKYRPLVDLGEPFQRDGMPMIVALERHEYSVWKYLIKNLDDKNSAIGCATHKDIDTVRRHWKKWYRVRLPEEGNKVMFRFYDPRVMFAFVMSLNASEASAFIGENAALFGYQDDQITVVSKSEACKTATPVAIGVGGFSMTKAQMASADDVALEAYKERLFDYFRTVWPRESEWLSDERLQEEIELAHQDAKKMMEGEPVQVGHIFRIARVRVFRPDIVADPWYWDVSMEERPNWRTGIYSSYVEDDFRANGKKSDIYYYKIQLMTLDNFGQSDPEWDHWVHEVYPDLILDTRPKDFDEVYQ